MDQSSIAEPSFMPTVPIAAASIRSIETFSEWIGLGDYRAEAFRIEKRDRRFLLSRLDSTDAAPIADDAIDRLAAALNHPVLAGDSAKWIMTDDHPRFRLKVLFDDGDLLVADSDSQNRGMIPWDCWIRSTDERLLSHSGELGAAIADLLPEGALHRGRLRPLAPGRGCVDLDWLNSEPKESQASRKVRSRANELDEALFHVGWAKDPIAELAELLKRGANVNATNHLGQTALSIAAQYRKYTLIKPLLDAGADPNLADDYGLTPLAYACHRPKNAEQLDAVSDLMTAGARALPCVRIVLEAPDSPLADILRHMILDACDNLDECDANGHTGLMRAAIYGRSKEAIRWIEAGAALDARSPDGKTALMFGLLKETIVSELIRAGANVNAKDASGDSVLGQAVCHRHVAVETIQALLEAGADPQARTKDGRSLVDYLQQRQKTLEMEFVVLKEFGNEWLGETQLNHVRAVRELVDGAISAKNLSSGA